MDLNEPPEAASQVVDLEECIEIELDRQANGAPNMLELPPLPYLKTELLLHQKKNLIRMIALEKAGHSILQMDAIGMGKILQTLCLILASLDKQAQSPEPGKASYFAPSNPFSRNRWNGARLSERFTEPMVEVLLSRTTLIVVQKVHVGHWASEIRKHTDLPKEYLIIEDPEDTMHVEQLKDIRIILLSREKLTELYASSPWFFQLRFVRLVLDEGGSSTGRAEKTRHATMIQAIHTDSKVLVDATPYHQGDSHLSKLRRLRELGETRAFFSTHRGYDELRTEWKKKVVQAKEGVQVAQDIVLQFLQDHLVRSQAADRPQLLKEERHKIMLRYNQRQAFSYNRLISIQALAWLTCKDTLTSDQRLDEYWRNLEDCTMDAFSYDLVCNPVGLLVDFDLQVLKRSPAFRGGKRAIDKREHDWAEFVEFLTAQGISQQRVNEISEAACLHKGADPTNERGLRTCSLCAKDSFALTFSPRCGHMICRVCLLQQMRAQQGGGDEAPRFEKDKWSPAALAALSFTCGCEQVFTVADLCEIPQVCVIPHGLSYQGSPKLAKILEFVLEKPPEEKVLIYCTSRLHRDLVANYIHSTRLPLADFSQSGAYENKRNRAKMGELIERFKQPVDAPSSSDSPPVSVALAAGTSTSTGVRGLDLHMLNHIIIVGGHLDPRVLKQLIGRGVRSGQRGTLHVWTLHMEGTFEDARVCDRSLSREDQLLSLKPVEVWTDKQPDRAYIEPFPMGCVVWWARGKAYHPAQVRPNSRMYQTLGQRGKVYVVTFQKKQGWVDPCDLIKFYEDERSLEDLDEASRKALGKNPQAVLQMALTEARRVGQIRNEGDDQGWEERNAGGALDQNKEAKRRRIKLAENKRVRRDKGANENKVAKNKRVRRDKGANENGLGALTREEAERQRKGKRKEVPTKFGEDGVGTPAKKPAKRKKGLTLDEEIDMEEDNGAALQRPRRNLRRMLRRQILDSIGKSRHEEPLSSGEPLPQETAATSDALRTPNSLEAEGSAFASGKDAANGVGSPRSEEEEPLTGGGVDSDEDEAFLERLRKGVQKRRCSRAVMREEEEDELPNPRALAETTAEKAGPSQGVQPLEIEEERVLGEENGSMLAQSTEDTERQLATAVVCTPTEALGVSSARVVLPVELPAVINVLPAVADDAPPVAPQKLLKSEPSSGLDLQSNQIQGAAVAVPFAPVSPPPQIRPLRQLGLAATQPSDRKEISQELLTAPSPAVTWQQEQAGPSGTTTQRPPAVNTETTPIDNEGSPNKDQQESSEEEKKQALKVFLQSSRVPAASIEQLLQRDFTIDHLELGMLSRQEVRQLVNDGELPEEHFKAGVLVFLDLATKRYKKGPD